MTTKLNSLIHDSVSAPLGDIIASVGQGVADAQAALDQGSLTQTLRLYEAGNDATLQMLKEIGYQPTFYTIPEVEGDITLAMKMELSSTHSYSPPQSSPQSPQSSFAQAAVPRKNTIRMYATPVDAGYSNRYGYTSEIQARIRFKIVPVPPPENLSNLIPQPEQEDEE